MKVKHDNDGFVRTTDAGGLACSPEMIDLHSTKLRMTALRYWGFLVEKIKGVCTVELNYIFGYSDISDCIFMIPPFF